jgi:F-type H+-transporting ATPase subunit a
LDFTNKTLGVLIEIGGERIYFTQTHLSTWVVIGVLVAVAAVVRFSVSRFKDEPGRLQNLVEAGVEMMSNFARGTLGAEAERYGGVYFSVFLFILASNYSSLFVLRPPTADLATTAALGILTFALIQITGIRSLRGGYAKSFFEPYPVFLPLNLIGELSRPVSLAFRLFGNVLGGLIIVGIVYNLLPLALRFIVPHILHAYFDVFVGALQAFIFTVLSMTFIRQKTALG